VAAQPREARKKKVAGFSDHAECVLDPIRSRAPGIGIAHTFDPGGERGAFRKEERQPTAS
jgi:hypothetical protein